jgi:4-amino-4-deoxy-L-arabinose transferase-like glycosyltransferase
VGENIAQKPARRWWLAVIIIVPYFAFLGTLPLFGPDEGRYAEIPREMLEKHDYVTPTLNYVLYFEKPVLHYWLTALSFKIFGLNEFAARFFPAVMSLLGIGGVYLLGRKLYGERAAMISALVLAGSLMWFVLARVNITDPVVSSLISLSLMSFLMWDVEQDPAKKRWCLTAYYGFAALATLAKGLIGLLFPGGIVFWYIILTRRFRIFKDMGLWWGIPLYLLIAAPWFIIVSLRNPDFAWFFFVHEHFLRFTTTIHNRNEPIYYFTPLIVSGLLPFTGYLIPALVKPLRTMWKSRFKGEKARPSPFPGEKARLPEAQPELFLTLWMVLIFVFFSVSGSKLPPYILPVFPAAALLIGRYMNEAEESWDGKGLFPKAHWWGISAAVFLVFVPTIGVFIQRDYPPAEILHYAILPTALIIAALVPALWLGRRKETGLTPYLYLTTLCFTFGLLPAIMDLIGPTKAERPITMAIQTMAGPDEPVVGLYNYMQNAPFYTQRRLVLVDYQGELKFGFTRAADRDEWQWTTDRFLKEWHSGKRLWVIVSDGGLNRLWVRTTDTTVSGRPIKDELGDYVLVERSGYTNLITNLPITHGH